MTKLPRFAVVAVILLVLLCSSRVPRAADPKPEPKVDQAPSKEVEQIARLTVANELMRRHWTRWVTGLELSTTATETAQAITGQLDLHTEARLLLPEIPTKPQRLNDFEKQAVDDIRSGLDEVWGKVPDGVQYIRGIRATATCTHCHRPIGAPGAKLQEGDLVGVFGVTIKE